MAEEGLRTAIEDAKSQPLWKMRDEKGGGCWLYDEQDNLVSDHLSLEEGGRRVLEHNRMVKFARLLEASLYVIGGYASPKDTGLMAPSDVVTHITQMWYEPPKTST